MLPYQCEGPSAARIPCRVLLSWAFGSPCSILTPLTSSTQLGWPSAPSPDLCGLPAYSRCSSQDGSQAGLQPCCDSAPFLETLNPASPCLGKCWSQQPPPHCQLRARPAQKGSASGFLRTRGGRALAVSPAAPSPYSLPPRATGLSVTAPSSARGSTSQPMGCRPQAVAGEHACCLYSACSWIVPSPASMHEGKGVGTAAQLLAPACSSGQEQSIC